MKKSNIDILKNIRSLLKRASSVMAESASPEENAHVESKIKDKEGTKKAA